MTPEIFKAAELIDGASAKDVFGDNPGGPKSGEFWDAAEVLSAAILDHRSDYSPDGVPLPVDEAFCREMGAEDYDQPDNLTCLVWEDDRGWLLSKGVFDQWYVYGNELPENAWPTTRPQLRNLLAALGK